VFLALWALPIGVLGAAAGGAGTRHRRARKHADPAPTA
jgi:cytochrome c-type biogenesis protein CcmH/NrfF